MSVSQFVVDLGVLEHLERFIGMGSENLDRDVFWLLSNVLAGTQEHIQVIHTLVCLFILSCNTCWYNCWLVHRSEHQ